jgi:hypothetical protein
MAVEKAIQLGDQSMAILRIVVDPRVAENMRRCCVVLARQPPQRRRNSVFRLRPSSIPGRQ